MNWSLLLSVPALVASLYAVWYARRAAAASEVQAKVAAAADHRAREPKLTFEVKRAAREADGRAWIEVTNDGPNDLDSVVIYRPETDDLVRYPVAPMGGEVGDEAELGPMPRLSKREFLLVVGPGAQRLPRFVIRTSAYVGEERWDGAHELSDVRFLMPRFVVS